LLAAALLCLALAPASAKSSRLVHSWKNPAYSGAHYHRILVIGMSRNVGVRADFEDTLSYNVTQLGKEAIPGNSILLRPDAGKLDLDYVRTQIREHKIEAVIVSRLVKVDKQVTYKPAEVYVVPYAYYNTFYGYFGTVYDYVYSPEYLREDTTVRVETNLYSTAKPEGELVWTGTSDTFNPRKADKTIRELVKLFLKDMLKQGVL
jgi:hypothetical protein